MSHQPQKLLIIGIGGSLAQMCAKKILSQYPKTQIYGIDNRRISNLIDKRIITERTKYTRSRLEQVFAQREFDTVLHLGRMSHVKSRGSFFEKRVENNSVGTQIILDQVLENQVKKIVVLSTFHVYGAQADNSVFLTEDSPLKAHLHYPELRDVVDMDRLTQTWMWQKKDKLDVVLLRPCNIIGPSLHNAMTKYLTHPYSPTPMDYNPMFQFINEFDMASTIVESIYKIDRGVFNVAPDDYLGIREAKESAGAKGVPVPIFLLKEVASLIKKTVWTVPDYLFDYLKYSCLIDSSAIKKELGDDIWRYNSKQALELLS